LRHHRHAALGHIGSKIVDHYLALQINRFVHNTRLLTRLEASEEELIAQVKAKLGSVKSPKTIEFVTELPKSPVGKVLKTELRKPYWEGQGRAVN
jgi:acyl-coenzyme A synthetase/AMP-(fatty) acid ligase